MNNHVRPSLSGRVRWLGGHPSIGTDSEVATKGDMFGAMRSALHILSAQDPVQAVVSYAQNSAVDTVMIAGRIAKENGKILFTDLEKRRGELLRSAQRLLSQA